MPPATGQAARASNPDEGKKVDALQMDQGRKKSRNVSRERKQTGPAGAAQQHQGRAAARAAPRARQSG